MMRYDNNESPVGPRVERETYAGRLRAELYGLRARRDELAAWLPANVRSPLFEQRLRDYNILAGRCEKLYERIVNVRRGLPELGMHIGTSVPIQSKTKTFNPH